MSVLQTINLKKYYGTEPNITRALITKPAIVLAVLTRNLDSKTSTEVLGLIKRISAEFRQTVVMITMTLPASQIGLSALRTAGPWSKEVADYDMAF